MKEVLFSVKFSPEFAKKFRNLPEQIRTGADTSIQKLLSGNLAAIRLHRYSNVRPPYWVFDALPNHSYQIACRREEDCFTLIDIDTHKKIGKRSKRQ